ncbi:Protein sym-1 [Galdieria sulphuraria]|nr:Protein sym-1 [Galdieria sulphuraria]
MLFFHTQEEYEPLKWTPQRNDIRKGNFSILAGLILIVSATVITGIVNCVRRRRGLPGLFENQYDRDNTPIQPRNPDSRRRKLRRGLLASEIELYCPEIIYRGPNQTPVLFLEQEKKLLLSSSDEELEGIEVPTTVFSPRETPSVFKNGKEEKKKTLVTTEKESMSSRLLYSKPMIYSRNRKWRPFAFTSLWTRFSYSLYYSLVGNDREAWLESGDNIVSVGEQQQYSDRQILERGQQGVSLDSQELYQEVILQSFERIRLRLYQRYLDRQRKDTKQTYGSEEMIIGDFCCSLWIFFTFHHVVFITNQVLSICTSHNVEYESTLCVLKERETPVTNLPCTWVAKVLVPFITVVFHLWLKSLKNGRIFYRSSGSSGGLSGTGGGSSGSGSSGGGTSSAGGQGKGGSHPLLSFWMRYNQLLESRPLLTKSLTSLIGFILGDILAQKFLSSDGILHLDRLLRMALFGFLIHGPTGHIFYTQLDKAIPGTEAWKVACKVAIDQVLWAPIFALIFFGFLAVLERQSFKQFEAKLRQDWKTAIFASWKVWPLAHAINFRFIPSHQRLLYINAVQIFYNVFLSIIGNKRTQIPRVSK